MNIKSFFLTVCLFVAMTVSAQYVSSVWKADLGNGKYRNPIIYADYSDPDVCRGADGYYMTASSFNCVPGLPILYSKDLVNWRIIAYALPRLEPEDHFSLPQHGNGVWAPAIRYHEQAYYIYWGDPDFGIYMIKAEQATGPWSEPVLVKAGKGLIDPCPLWDEDGQAYMSFAFAGSRKGLKSVLLMTRLTPDGTNALGEARIIYDGHRDNPTIEGTKLYKYEEKYYIFSPAGGVSTGWQEVLRADHPFGPWEAKTVMAQGKSDVNGPHQGGWVRTEAGEDWFIHFQDVGVVGRIVHLNPMIWENGWPVIGVDKDADGIGDPVRTYKKPKMAQQAVCTPQESDEFDSIDLGLQWQWHANPQPQWYFIDPTEGGRIRLFSADWTGDKLSLWDAPNLLLQKFPAPDFTVTTQLSFEPNPRMDGERGGLVVMGMDYCAISIEDTKEGLVLTQRICRQADRKKTESIQTSLPLTADPQLKAEKGVTMVKDMFLRVRVKNGKECSFSYSLDGNKYQTFGESFIAKEGKWIGAKVGLYCSRAQSSNDGGHLDVENFVVSK